MEFTKFEELKEKIRNRNDENSDFMCELIDCIQNYTKVQFEQMKDTIRQNFDDEGKAFGRIITVLADQKDREELKRTGLYSMDDTLHYLPVSGADLRLHEYFNRQKITAKKEKQKMITLGYGFLECDYEHFCQLIESYTVYKGKIKNKNGKETLFNYQLLFSDRLLQQERILKYCGELYGITAPILFSPLARRLVQVQVVIENIRDNNDAIDNIDLQLEENGLQGILVLGKYAAWNIKIQNQDLDIRRDKGNPLGEERHFHYMFDGCEKNQYIVPLMKDKSFFSLHRIGTEIQIQYLEEYSGKFIKITVNMVTKKAESPYCFSNAHTMNDEIPGKMEKLLKERLRSEADILYAIHQHKSQLGLEFKEIAGSERAAYRNYKKYRNELGYRTMEEIGLKGKKTIYLYFKNQKNSIYADDYMNYLCDYFAAMYPEITWRGGYC